MKKTVLHASSQSDQVQTRHKIPVTLGAAETGALTIQYVYLLLLLLV